MQKVKVDRQSLSGQWALYDENPNEWRLFKKHSQRQPLDQWRQVAVPASVQEALWKIGEIKHPYRNMNSRKAEWIERRDWIYGLELDLDATLREKARRVFIEFENISERCEVYLDGQLVGEHEGAGIPFDFEITSLLAGTGETKPQLQVVIPASTPEDPQVGWTENTRSLKGRMGYGWDFTPRLVKTGILGEVSLSFTGDHRLRDLWSRPHLNLATNKATIELSVKIDGPANPEIQFEILLSDQIISQATSTGNSDGVAAVTLEITDPQLWWPNGLGSQPLYTARAYCTDSSDSIETTFGLREISWQRQPDSRGDESPMTLVVNGKAVFQKGWNWVPSDAMGGPRADRKTRKLLALAQASEANIIRSWGGADPESKVFYDECDRYGLLVWQELPLSSAGISNLPPEDVDYLARLAPYAERVVKTRRNHPSLALWGGGNELTYAENVPLTMENTLAQVLAKVLADCDPDLTFRPSSPLGPVFDSFAPNDKQWDVHGPWTYQEDSPGPYYGLFNRIQPLLHSELGLPGETSLSMQKRFLSKRHRSREATNPVRRHHNGAWWEHKNIIEAIFGPINEPELAILASQWLQAEGLRYYIEETRRRWPYTAGIYLWQFNEPWPTVTCTSAVSYGAHPKLAYYAARIAHQPVAITARYTGLTFPKGQDWTVSIFAQNEIEAFEADLSVTLTTLDGKELFQLTKPVEVVSECGLPVSLGEFKLAVPADFEGVALLDLKLGDRCRNRYLFSNRESHPLKAVLKSPEMLKKMFISNG